MEYNLSYPDVTHRKQILPYALHRGSVVAFRSWLYDRPRTGIIVMESPGWMLAAVNLYEEEGRIWYFDEMPFGDITKEVTKSNIPKILIDSNIDSNCKNAA
jgi:hypothetical protein